MSGSSETQLSSSPQSIKDADQPSYSASPEPRKSTYRILRDAGFRSMNDFMFSHGLKLHNDEDLEMAKEMIERMKEEDSMGEDLRRLEFRAANDEEDVEDRRGVESSEEENGVVELVGVLDVVSDEEEDDGFVESIGYLDVVSDMKREDEDDVEESAGVLDVVSDEEVDDGAVESIGFAEVVSDDEVDDGSQVSGIETVEELDRISSREKASDENVDVDVDVHGEMVDDDSVSEAFGYEDFDGGGNDDYGYFYDDQNDFVDDYDDDPSYNI
ncbi:uncharacterized protein EAF01_010996 [Botrytis porri]|uniref:uncharacterized protein n=1 Tax=Botrytis porri TaxID=87229 RepID=UPI0019025215|nr:uncharacterized protein EAF01_010996 [Botrytis porri]KAF7887842.1 hypothetical protein EAF01_010996 [Botrytis porri]